MYWNIKSLLGTLLFSVFLASVMKAQVTETIPKTSKEKERFGGLYLGYVQPNKFGITNGYGTGLDYKGGFSIKYYRNLYGLSGDWKNLVLGVEFNLIKATVTDKDMFGNYEKVTNTNTIKLIAGYAFSLNKHIDFTPQFGFSTDLSYRGNDSGKDSFYDGGLSYSITPEFTYRIYKSIGVYIGPELRYEHLKMGVAKLGPVNFNHNMLFNINVGVSLFLK
ncbi:hypothetical protein [Neptunitalea lumnitzerae]|uniref:Outer membrane protein beta-barrel domain-containing protein n=1 Tax=Neptunitalea lumnitzerae TaxID=2965509 RepID=A0ABQ5MLA1_9FLAO|nr:hypothetical protein [Neptunitalea sp. Y10]GLB50177.1 hypothetical protein Y10_25450 [Neptunitalea sp. Y10]